MKPTTLFIFVWVFVMTTMSGLAQTGQVSITLLSLTERASWGSLGHVELINHTSDKLEVYLVAKLHQNNRLIKREQSVQMILNVGHNRLDLSGLNLTPPNGVTTSENSPAVFRQICIEVFDSKQELLATACEDLLDLPMTPPYLVYPFDQEALSTLIPVFTWTPPMPVKPSQRTTYTLKIVEITGSKNAFSAMMQAQAFFVQEGIFQTVLPYPVSAPPLSPDKQYAWQVEVFVEGQPAGKTEIWEFSIEKPQPEPEVVIPRGYVELKRSQEAGIYEAKGDIRFRFDPRYGEPRPDFIILDNKLNEVRISERKLEKVRSNLFILHLPPGGGLKVNDFYTLQIKDAEGHTHYLPFKYLLAEN